MRPRPPRTIEPLRFRAAPLAAAAVCFACGIAASRWHAVPTPLLLGSLAALFALTWMALRRAPGAMLWTLAALWFTLGWAAALWQPEVPAPRVLQAAADGLSRSVVGRLDRLDRLRALPLPSAADADQAPPWEQTEIGPAGDARLSLDVGVTSVEHITPDTAAMLPATGGVRVTVYGEPDAVAALAASLHCGDRLRVPLRMRLPDRYRDPGAFDYGDYLLRQQGIAARASADVASLERLGPGAASWSCRLAAAQAWAGARLAELPESRASRALPALLRLSAADTAMLDAMLLGDRTGLSHTLRTAFERTGTFHLFVVSGLHVALVAGGLLWLLRRLRLPLLTATLLALGGTAAYAALTGFGEPARRALAMTAVYLLTRLLGRTPEPLNALGAAALAMLAWSPRALFDASLQMTLAVIVAIAGIAAPLARRTWIATLEATHDVFRRPRRVLDPRLARRRLMLEVWGEAVAGLLGQRARRLPALLVRAVLLTARLALTGAVAELVLALPMALYFHRAAVFALPANLLVLPVVGLLAGAGVLTLVCAVVSPWLAVLPGALTALLLHGVVWAVRALGNLPAADVRVPQPAPLVAIAALVVWAVCCWAVRRGRWPALAAALALPAIFTLLLWPVPLRHEAGALEVTALDVGQGDSLLLVGPTGGTMLVDAGGPVGSHGVSEIVSSFDVGEQVVASYLWTRGVRRLDIVVLTHAHTDHMGGMPAILEDFRPRELWVSADTASPLYHALLEQAARLGILVRHLHAGDRPAFPGVEVSVLSPQPAYANPGAPRNDDSLVLRVQLGQASVLLEGDAERPSEDAMLAAGLVRPVTLLKAGHHGSRTSSEQAFVDAAAPVDAVISVGRHNTFGHPRAEVIARFAARGTHLFRTDAFGLTTFLLTPDGGLRERVGDLPLPVWPRAAALLDSVPCRSSRPSSASSITSNSPTRCTPADTCASSTPPGRGCD